MSGVSGNTEVLMRISPGKVLPLIVGLLVALVAVPGRAQQPADIMLVNAVPDVAVDVDVDDRSVATDLVYGASVGGDILRVEYGRTARVEVREAGTTTVIAAAPDVFLPQRGTLVIHYGLDGDVTVSSREFLWDTVCDGRAQEEFWPYANAPPITPLIDGEVPSGDELLPGEHEIIVVREGTETVVTGPDRFTVDAGEVALLFLTGSQALGNLQLLVGLTYPVDTEDCSPRQPSPSGARPAGMLPDVQILHAIPSLSLQVQLGRRSVEALEFGESFNDDELGGIAGDSATVTVRLAAEILVGPVNVAITGDAGSLVIHRDSGGKPTVTYFEDPVEPLCEGEGGLVLRNAAAVVANWQVGTGPVADDEVGTFPVLMTTPELDPGKQFSRALPAGDYLARAFNFVNGQPVAGIEELALANGVVTVVYLVGQAPGLDSATTIEGGAAEEVALAALVRADDVPPAPPGTEIRGDGPGSPVSVVDAPSVQYESCSLLIPTDVPGPPEPDGTAGAIGGFATGAAQVSQYVIVYQDESAAGAALARHRALAEDCTAALEQRTASAVSDASGHAQVSDAPGSVDGYRVRVEFQSDGSRSDEESAVLRLGPVVSFVLTSDAGSPHQLDRAWVDQLLSKAADRLVRATSAGDLRLLAVTYDVPTVACAAPAPPPSTTPTPGPAPTPTTVPVPTSVPTGASAGDSPDD